MKITKKLVLLALVLSSGVVQADDCSVLFSMCLTAEANAPTANGTQACISQRTACVAGTLSTERIVVPPIIAQSHLPGEPGSVQREHHRQNRSLLRSQADERQELRDQQRAERDAQNWKAFDGLLQAQARERQRLHSHQREERRELTSDQKFDGKWLFW